MVSISTVCSVKKESAVAGVIAGVGVVACAPKLAEALALVSRVLKWASWNKPEKEAFFGTASLSPENSHSFISPSSNTGDWLL